MNREECSDTVVVGLGNPILRDDGVGICVVGALRERLEAAGVAVVDGGLAGLGLVDVLAGFGKVILIDGIQTQEGKPGDIYRLRLEDIEASAELPWSHHLGLTSVLKVFRRAGMEVPHEVILLAIELKDIRFGEGCTPEVEQAIPHAAEMVCSIVGLSP